MLLKILFFVNTFLLFWMYLLYPLTLFIINLKNKKPNLNDEYFPYVNLLMCVYNEKDFIHKRIKNIQELSYPKDKLKIVIIDSSDDGTYEIIKREYGDKIVLLHEEERKGKAFALNMGIKKCDSNIIILTDATVLFDKNAVNNIVIPFQDDGIGCTTGRYQPLGGEHVFWSFKNVIKRLESQVDSTTFVSGDLSAIRKDIIDFVDVDTLCDDVNIALKTRNKGYRVKYAENAIVYEKVTQKIQDFKAQKTRRAIGGIQETLRFKHMIFNLKFGYFGFLIMPARLLYTVLNPIIISFFIGIGSFYLLKVNYYLLLLLPLYLIINFNVKNNIVFSTINNFIITVYVQLISLIRYMRKDYNVKWDKIGLFKNKV